MRELTLPVLDRVEPWSGGGGSAGRQPVASRRRLVVAAQVHHLVRAHARGIDFVLDLDRRQQLGQQARPGRAAETECAELTL